MKSFIKTPEEIEILREGGRRLAQVLDVLERSIAPGMTTKDLDDIAEKEIRRSGDEPAFLGYRPWDASRAYPATLCVSINDEIVHGIPRKDCIVKEGDIVGLDLGIKHCGLFTDSARTVGAGKISDAAQKLLDVTREALGIGIAAAGKHGVRVGDIGTAIEEFVRKQPKKYGIVRGLGGHGVGREIHEDPFIPNHRPDRSLGLGFGMRLKPGMVIAIEPMLAAGKPGIALAPDGYTYRTKDRSLAAHFEHTILITGDGAGTEILTKSRHPE